MPIQIRIRIQTLPQDLHMLDSRNICCLLLLTGVPVYIVLFFSSAVIVFKIFDSILNFSGKSVVSLYICWKWIRIRQNDADPTGSGSTTLLSGLF
jgi:hypothetical protein